MFTLTVSDLDPAIEERLRVRAAARGHSVEAEVRAIVTEAVGQEPPDEKLDLAETIRRRFAPLGGVDDLEIPPRGRPREAPRFD